ncbi:MAG: hypothetical protein CO094_13345 [Anaerolineae bacterium CG_4_9_14_3_um_filter_57_17]|nr:MAG: hypothetical protein AUK01_01075 [Anaerolineae bacterium CG2_30_57_67]PJB64354.1 MAG: hypothetical protein CO094_13345 [Anaerolineae bacterium CG_4_9_14_3_um_filter_57_17]
MHKFSALAHFRLDNARQSPIIGRNLKPMSTFTFTFVLVVLLAVLIIKGYFVVGLAPVKVK